RSKRVNALILEHMQSSVPLIPQVAEHIIAAGGKRLRPLLVLAGARLVGVDNDRPLALAACVEFIHTATLLHDDVVDESDLRRGRQTAKAVFGNQARDRKSVVEGKRGGRAGGRRGEKQAE